MYRWSPTKDGLTFLSTLWWCESNTHSVEPAFPILNLDLLLAKEGDVRLRGYQAVAAPNQSRDHTTDDTGFLG
jgi:hypothetical protein